MAYSYFLSSVTVLNTIILPIIQSCRSTIQASSSFKRINILHAISCLQLLIASCVNTHTHTYTDKVRIHMHARAHTHTTHTNVVSIVLNWPFSKWNVHSWATWVPIHTHGLYSYLKYHQWHFLCKPPNIRLTNTSTLFIFLLNVSMWVFGVFNFYSYVLQ